MPCDPARRRNAGCCAKGQGQMVAGQPVTVKKPSSAIFATTIMEGHARRGYIHAEGIERHLQPLPRSLDHRLFGSPDRQECLLAHSWRRSCQDLHLVRGEILPRQVEMVAPTVQRLRINPDLMTMDQGTSGQTGGMGQIKTQRYLAEGFGQFRLAECILAKQPVCSSSRLMKAAPQQKVSGGIDAAPTIEAETRGTSFLIRRQEGNRLAVELQVFRDHAEERNDCPAGPIGNWQVATGHLPTTVNKRGRDGCIPRIHVMASLKLDRR